MNRSVWYLLGLAGCAGATPRGAYETWMARTQRAHTAPPPRSDRAAWSPTRDALVRTAITRDPGVTARTQRARALVETAVSEAALPSPEVGAQVWNLPFARPWSLGDADMYMIELRQRFPAAGALSARGRRSLSEAAMALSDASARERDLTRAMIDAWATYVASALHHRVHHAHLASVDAMDATARARLAASRGSLDDIARVDVERAQTRRALVRFEAERRRAARVINTLAQRNPDAPIELSIDVQPETVRASLDVLTARAVAVRSQVADARSRAEAARHAAEAARIEATTPEFTAGVSGWFDPNRHHGFGLSLGMTLPWLWGPMRSRARAERTHADAEATSVQEAEAAVRADVADAYSRVEALARELVTLRSDARRAAERSLDAARAGYTTGASTLLAWIDAARTLREVAIDEADLTLELARSMAQLDWAVGEPVPRAPVDFNGPTEAP